jgi:hypothetical protein
MSRRALPALSCTCSSRALFRPMPPQACRSEGLALPHGEAGKLPPIPDFCAKTHERFRGKLAEVIALVKAGDAKALKAYKINPISSSPKAIDRYRALAITALEARG